MSGVSVNSGIVQDEVISGIHRARRNACDPAGTADCAAVLEETLGSGLER